MIVHVYLTAGGRRYTAECDVRTVIVHGAPRTASQIARVRRADRTVISGAAVLALCGRETEQRVHRAAQRAAARGQLEVTL